jgi:hypothetical protein
VIRKRVRVKTPILDINLASDYVPGAGVPRSDIDRRNGMGGSQQLDDAARSLARDGSGVSRRSVLRGVVAGTFGSVAFSKVAFARGGHGSGCTGFCNEVFGKGTEAASSCIQDAMDGTGLCYTCGPASTAGTRSICCTRDRTGHCSEYGGATCCGSGYVCQDGNCRQVCAGANQPCAEDSDCCGELICGGAAVSSGGMVCIPAK